MATVAFVQGARGPAAAAGAAAAPANRKFARGPCILPAGSERRDRRWQQPEARTAFPLLAAVALGASAARVRRPARKRGLVAAGAERGAQAEKPAGSAKLALAAVCLLSTVLNRMSFRFVLVPMGQLTHLLSITTNFVYITFFSLVCLSKSRSGSLAKDNWDFTLRGGGWVLLAAAGLAECTAFTTMPLFARHLPGSMLAVLSQSMLPFSMLFSIAVFKRGYDALQYLGVAVVMLGILVCSYPKYVADLASGASAGGGGFLLNAAGLLLSYSFIAGSFVFKEKAFRAYSAEHPDGKLDGNMVNLAAALWQCAALWLLWPFNFKFITPLSPAAYFASAKAVFTSPAAASVVAVYWAANIYYLGTSLAVISRLSSVVAMLIGALAVPISALIFCLKWPVLGAEAFSLATVLGLVVITGGLLIYNHKQLKA